MLNRLPHALLCTLTALALVACNSADDDGTSATTTAAPPPQAAPEQPSDDGAGPPDGTPDAPAAPDTTADLPAIDPASPLGKDLAAIDALRQDMQMVDAIKAAQQAEETYSDDAAAVAAIRAKVAQLSAERRTVRELDFARSQLGADHPADVRTAARQIMAERELAPIMLRSVLKNGSDRAAVEAAVLLGKLGDERAVDPILQRFLKEQRGPVRTQLTEALDQLAEHLPAFDARRLYRMTLPDPDYHQRDFVRLLGAYVQRAHGSDAAAFNAALGDDDAYAKLSTYVENAYVKGDDDLRAWALSQAERFDVVLPGLLGRYYIGSNFDTFVFERLDSEMELLDAKAFGFPDKRAEYFSVRWTGKLLVEQAGEYAIRFSSDDGHRMWIGGNKLIDYWDQGPHYERVQVQLEPGLHDIVIEYQQASSECYIKLSWRGPGIKGEPLLDDRCLRFAPRAKPAEDN